jgi:hypothetical protein
MAEQIRHEVAEEGDAVVGSAAKLAAVDAVRHGY